jgi:hypothetical protein
MNNENIIIDDNDQFDDESGDNVGMNDILAFKKGYKSMRKFPMRTSN